MQKADNLSYPCEILMTAKNTAKFNCINNASIEILEPLLDKNGL